MSTSNSELPATKYTITRRRPLLGALFFVAGWFGLMRAAAAVADTFDRLESTQYEQYDRDQWASALSVKDEVHVVVLGNSHAGAIDVASLGQPAVVLNRGGGDIFEVELFARALLDRLPRVRRMLIALSYYTFDWDNAVDDAMRIRRIHTYATLPTWAHVPGDLNLLLIGKADPWLSLTHAVRSDAWKGVWRGMATGKSTAAQGLEVAQKLDAAGGEGCAYPTAQALNDRAQRRVDEVLTTAHSMQASRPGVHTSAEAALRRTIHDAKRRGVEVVLFTPPFWSGYNREYQQRDAAMMDGMIALAKVVASTMDIVYIGAANNPAYVDDATQFMDSDHLNRCGAERFTRQWFAVSQTTN